MHATQETIDRIISELDMEVEVRTDYSGRGMYGATCLAIVTGQGQGLGDILNALYLMGLNMSVEEDDTDAITAILRSARIDSMGYGSVIYFPVAQTAERNEPDQRAIADAEAYEWWRGQQ